MNIVVINGSPKAGNSTTVHSMYYLERLYRDDKFTYIDAGQRIKIYMKDFSLVENAIESADLIVFSYPVYTFIAPSQLHCFIELMKLNRANVKGKFCTQITTSKHFYDSTAHRYIEDNACDLGMKYIKGLSADMEDLLSEKGQKELVDWFNLVKWSIGNDYFERKEFIESGYQMKRATPKQPSLRPKKGDVIVIADYKEESENLALMVRRFQSVSDRNVRVVKLSDIAIKGGCLGCFNCAVSGKCIYNDRFDDYLRNEVQRAECIVYAFSIKDHSMGSRFKMYDDRQFCNGHRTVTMGSPVGYIVSGPYKEEQNLRTIIEARAEVGGNILAGVATDESSPDSEIDKLARTISYILDNKVSKPQNFYGVGGMKIFRDLIYTMRGMMKADHRFFKENGQYDFPQKRKGTIIKMYLVGALMSNKTLMKKAGESLSDGMVAPYKKVVKALDSKQCDKSTE